MQNISLSVEYIGCLSMCIPCFDGHFHMIIEILGWNKVKPFKTYIPQDRHLSKTYTFKVKCPGET